LFSIDFRNGTYTITW